MKICTLRGWAALARRAVIVPGLLLALAGTARAQEIGITSTEPGVPIILDGRYGLRSRTPFVHPLPSGGFTRIRAGGGAFELRRAPLSWDGGGNPVVQNHSRRNALIGTLLPGTGCLLSGRALHGLTEIAALGYLAGNGVMSLNETDRAAQDYRDLQGRFADEDDLEQKRRLGVEVEKAYRRWDRRRDHLQGEKVLVGAVAGVAALESWWFNQPLMARSRGKQLVVDVPRLSRTRATLASFCFPGFGQAYRGQKRSALYLAAETYLLQEMLDSFTRRKLHESDYLLTQRALAEDGLSAADEAQLRGIWERKQKATEDLEIFAGSAGAVWLINMIDIVASNPEREAAAPGGHIGLSTSPGGNLGLAWTRRY